MINLHKSVGLFMLLVPTEVTSKRVSQANYFYIGHRFTCLYASTVLKSYSYIIYHKFILFLYEIKFPYQCIQMPIRTFSQDLKNFCMKISKKH